MMKSAIIGMEQNVYAYRYSYTVAIILCIYMENIHTIYGMGNVKLRVYTYVPSKLFCQSNALYYV